MGCIGIVLPILGLAGYYYGIDWLFYIAGGLTAVMDILSLIRGELRFIGTIITISFWITGYKVMGAFWDGLIWGSCASTIVIVFGTFVFIAITTGIGAAIAGLMGIFEWIKGMFGKEKMKE